MTRGIGQQPRDLDQAVGVERLVLDQDGGAGRNVCLGVPQLVAGCVGIWDDRHGQRKGCGLRQRRGPGPADGEIRGGKRIGHLVVQEGEWPVPVLQGLGQARAGGDGRAVAGLPGHVDHAHALHQPGQRPGDRVVDPADGLGPAEDEQDPLAGSATEASARGVHVDDAEVPDGRPRHAALGVAQRLHGLLVADGDHGRPAGNEPDASSRHHVAVPQHGRDPQQAGDQHGRDGHVAARGEDGRRAVREQQDQGLRDREPEANGVQQEVGVPPG